MLKNRFDQISFLKVVHCALVVQVVASLIMEVPSQIEVLLAVVQGVESIVPLGVLRLCKECLCTKFEGVMVTSEATLIRFQQTDM